MEDFWKERYVLTDLLFHTNLSMADIAKELDVTPSYLSQEIHQLGLAWIRRKNRKMSRGQSSLTTTLQKLFPNEVIENEYHIGDRLRLDVYCPTYKVAIEYHGRQHYEYVNRFFECYEDFVRAQQRDLDKIEKCKELGITLIIFKYNDDLSEDVVYDRILSAIQVDVPHHATPRHTKKSMSMKGTPIYEDMKAKRKEFGKQMRDRIKQERKDQKKIIY